MSDIFLAIKQLRDLLQRIEQFKNAQRPEMGLAVIDARRCALRSDFEKCIFEMLPMRPDGVTTTEWARVIRITERFAHGLLADELTPEVCRAFREEADPILFAISQRARALVVPSVMAPIEVGPTKLHDRTPTMQIADLEEFLSITSKLDLTPAQQEIRRALAEHDGAVPVAMLGLRFGWGSPASNWNRHRAEFNRKLRRNRWELVTVRKHAVARRMPTRSKK